MTVSQELMIKFSKKLAELTGFNYAPKEYDQHLTFFLEKDGGKIFIDSGRWNENKVNIMISTSYMVDRWDEREAKIVKNSVYLDITRSFPILSFGFTVNPENWEKALKYCKI